MHLHTRLIPALATALFAPLLGAAPALAQERADVPELYRELTFRSIGPAVTGGRIHDVEALPHDPSTIYVATASGGLWKTTNKGTTWRPLFDDQPTSTFGDLAIAPSDPSVLWVGTGEQNNRQSTSWGSGVYRSLDAGETWTHRGLTETRHVGRVLVHPLNPDIAWVAAQGNLWKATPDRGVYRTRDGGESWERVLYVDTLTGGTDLAMDACDPDVLYAATYQRLRKVWGFNGGGPGSGIWRSTDGGDSWTRMTNGIPAGDKGRIGLAAAADACGVVQAIIEHADTADAQGVYRSEDGGDSWTRMSGRNGRPMYYSHIFIDPTNADRVYTLARDAGRSEDGGRTWTDVSGRPTYDVGVHSDHHSLWIDPGDSEHYYLAGDAGLYETWDRGETYIRIDNLPIAQIYAIGVDARDPYNVYIGLQDNHSWMGPGATRHWAGVLDRDWQQIGFGDGMYHQTDPSDPRIVYSNSQNGGYIRVDTETGDRLAIAPRPPAGDPDYRWDWVSPSLVSTHDPDVVYVGGNRLFISRDRGETWERTEDLTRAMNRDTMRLMGVKGSEITLSRHDGTASWGEITTIAESPVDARVLWVGTDDGNLQVSRDGGESWTNVAANVGVPEGTYVSRVFPSFYNRATAWATFDAHREGDFAPYVFRTTDFGRTWTERTDGLEGAGSGNVIAEHPSNRAVAFLGTEHALWVTTDTGRSWHRLGSNLPTTLFDDLLIHPVTGDLVAGTHGRGVFILDDASPLAHLAGATGPAHLFAARDPRLHLYWKDTSYRGQGEWDGDNPPAQIFSYLLNEAADSARLVIRREGDVIRTLPADGDPGVIHRVAWDLRYPPPGFDEDEDTPEDLAQPVGERGPLVAPGTYTVTLETDAGRSARSFHVHPDPRLPMLTAADYRSRESFLLEIVALRREVRELREAREAEETREAEAPEIGAPRGEDPESELDDLSDGLRELYQELTGSGVTQGTLHPPTPPQRAALDALRRELEALR